MNKKLLINGQEQVVTLREQSAARVVFVLNEKEYAFSLRQGAGASVVLEDASGRVHRGFVGAADRDGISPVWVNGAEMAIGSATRGRRAAQEEAGGSTKAPLTGVVQEVCVAAGVSVEKGAALVVMEAMKMQMTIAAPYAGRVSAVHAQAGEQVTEGTELVTVEAVADAE